MAMTMTQKILAAHTDQETVEAGQLVNCRVDLVLGNDITAPVAIKEFAKIGVDKVFDKSRVVLVPDHFVPNKDIKSAEQAKMLRDFTAKYELENSFNVGTMGIEHCLLPEAGLVGPGDLVVGADSHTCTYGALGAFSTGIGSTDLASAMATGEVWFKVPEAIRFTYSGRPKPWVSGKDLILYTIGDIGVDGALYQSMEFTGEAISALSMDSRFTMANMAIEAGAKNGIFPVDDTTLGYVKDRAKRSYMAFAPDPDAQYSAEYEYSLSEIEPQVAFPHLPSNTKGISEASGIPMDQVVIGSCTNGRIEDLRMTASVLTGKKVHSETRLIIFPGTQQIYLQALREGLIEVFIEAGAAVSTPTCGPCLGGHMGILAKGERALATTNRNFVGRMGDPQSEVYLANPAIAAATAVLGRIASPEELGLKEASA